MKKDNVTELKKPETFVDDPITDVLRSGARKLLAEALEAEMLGSQDCQCVKQITKEHSGESQE